MNEVTYETESRLERQAKQRQDEQASRKLLRWSPKATMISLWLLLGVSAFALAYFYVGEIRNQLAVIQQSNQNNIEEINQRLAELQTTLNTNAEQAAQLAQQFETVRSELNAVHEQMSLAGDSLSTSAATKQALNERITDLSTELEELRKSIKKLEEAARVY